jgi:hypothetical protein
MCSLLSLAAGFAALALLPGVIAAPAGLRQVVGPKAPPLEKYLLDDTDCLLVIDVKQVLASPMVKKGLHKQIEALVDNPAAQLFLKDAGFDPLKDVDRVIVCVGRSCWSGDELGREDGPFILVRGRFDVPKARARMARLAADKVGRLLDLPHGKAILFEPGPYVAPLDSTTLLITGKKALVADALAKAAGKKATKLANQQAVAEIKKLKANVTVQAFALESTIQSTTRSSFKDAKGRPLGFRVKHYTLGDGGFRSAHVAVTVKDEARGSVVLTVKDRALLKAKAEGLDKVLRETRMFLGQQAMRDPKKVPIARFCDGILLTTQDETITLQGAASVDLAPALLDQVMEAVR